MFASDTLAGLRVIDFTRLLPGPFCTMLLADLGAEVIKVEDPAGGDYARWYPPRIAEGDDGYGAFFAALNEGKKSVCADLRDPEARARIERLLATADVLVEGFRPGVLERLGFEPDALRARNPRLIIARISGWGQDGPLARRAGHDLGFLARSGVLARTGPADEPPALSSVQIADLAGGALHAAFAIALALYRREQTGEGGVLDVSMAEGAMSLLRPHVAMAQAEGGAGPRGREMLTGGLPCYRCYRTADGGFLAVAALEPVFWQRFCAATGLEEMLSDGWATGERGEQVAATIAARLAERTRDAWMEIFDAVDACVEPVLDVDELLRDAHWNARRALVDGLPRPPTSPPVAQRPVPRLGEHDALFP